MYGTMANMPVMFKTWLIGNHTINIKADNGVKRRIKMIQKDSDFVDDIEEDDYDYDIPENNKPAVLINELISLILTTSSKHNYLCLYSPFFSFFYF